MRNITRWTAALVILGGLTTACSRTAAQEPPDEPPALVEAIEGTELNRIVLNEKAVERLGVETVAIGEASVSAGAPTTTSIPYSAVLYGLNGDPFVYTSPEPRTFVRAAVTIDRIEGDRAILQDGPPAGTDVVTVGAAELFGAEFEFKEE